MIPHFRIVFHSFHTEESYLYMIGAIYGIIHGIAGIPITELKHGVVRNAGDVWTLSVPVSNGQAYAALELINKTYGNIAEIELVTA